MLEVVIRAHVVDDALGQLVEVMVLPVRDVKPHLRHEVLSLRRDRNGRCASTFAIFLLKKAARFIGASLVVVAGRREHEATEQTYHERLAPFRKFETLYLTSSNSDPREVRDMLRFLVIEPSQPLTLRDLDDPFPGLSTGRGSHSKPSRHLTIRSSKQSQPPQILISG